MKNRQKGSIVLLVIIGVILIIAAVWYYVSLQKNPGLGEVSTNSGAATTTEGTTKMVPLTSGDVVGNFTGTVFDQEQVTFSATANGLVTLYAPKVSIGAVKTGTDYCNQVAVGIKTYSGDFKLSFAGSDFDLGNLTFVKGTQFDGELYIKSLGSNQKFILIPQYADCNGNAWTVYSFDTATKSLKQYMFVMSGKAVKSVSSKTLSPQFNSSGELMTSYNGTANDITETNTWKYDTTSTSQGIFPVK